MIVKHSADKTPKPMPVGLRLARVISIGNGTVDVCPIGSSVVLHDIPVTSATEMEVGDVVNLQMMDNKRFAFASQNAVVSGESTSTGNVTIQNGDIIIAGEGGSGAGTITSVTAGNGLTGGGTSGSVSINAVAGDGIVVLDNSITVSSDVVRTSRSISTGSGLTGGGDLSANRTLSIALATTSGLNTTSGLAVGAGNGISVGTSTVAVNQTYGFTWTSAHTFSSGFTAAESTFTGLLTGTSSTFSGNVSVGTTSGGLNIGTTGAAAKSIRVAGSINVGTATGSTNGYIYTSGSIGVGKSAADYPLDVAGKIYSSTDVHANLSLITQKFVGSGIGNTLFLADNTYFRSEQFASGFAGNGWQIYRLPSTGSKSEWEVDNLTVRGTLRVYELLIQQIRATNGSVFVSAAAKIESVTGTGPSYTLTVEGGSSDYAPFAVGDVLRAQRVSLGTSTLVWQSDLTVTAISAGGNTRAFTATLRTGTTVPAAGMEYVRFGNTTDTNRQGAVYLTADDSGAPFIDIVNDITSHADWNTAGKIKTRIGRLTGITGAPGTKVFTVKITATGGTFVLNVNVNGTGNNTGSITYSTTAATTASNILAALASIATVGSGNVSVSAVSASQYTVSFIENLNNKQVSFTSVSSALTGTSPSITVSVLANYGIWSGTGTSTNDLWIKMAEDGIVLNNVPLKMYKTGNQTVDFAANGNLKIGTNVVNPSTTALNWDGTTLSVKGSVEITGGSGWEYLTDKPVSIYDINSSEHGFLTTSSRMVFSETFSDISGALSSNRISNWEVNSAVSGYSLSIVNVSDQSIMTGGSVLRATRGVSLIHKTLIPYSPKKLYRSRVVLRRQTNPTSASYVTLGFVGIASDGTTIVSPEGTTSPISHNHITFAQHPVASSWITYTGYTSGSAATGFSPTVVNQNPTSVANPGEMHTNVRYLRPYMQLNHATPDGVIDVDSFIVESYDIPSDSGLYMSPQNLGFWDGSSWKTYMNSYGDFYLGGTSGSLTWDATTSDLNISGSLRLTGTTYSAPTVTGLYGDSSKLGYYNAAAGQGGWRSWFDSTGNLTMRAKPVTSGKSATGIVFTSEDGVLKGGYYTAAAGPAYGAFVTQWQTSATDGSILAANGKVQINSDGITVAPGTSYSNQNAYSFSTTGTDKSYMSVYNFGLSSSSMEIANKRAVNSSLYINSETTTQAGGSAYISINAKGYTQMVGGGDYIEPGISITTSDVTFSTEAGIKIGSYVHIVGKLVGYANSGYSYYGEGTLNMGPSNISTGLTGSYGYSNVLEVQNTQLMRYKYGPSSFNDPNEYPYLEYTVTSNTGGYPYGSFFINFAGRDSGSNATQELWHFQVYRNYQGAYVWSSQRMAGTANVFARVITNTVGSSPSFTGTLKIRWWVGSTSLSYNTGLEITVSELSSGLNAGHYGTFSVGSASSTSFTTTPTTAQQGNMFAGTIIATDRVRSGGLITVEGDGTGTASTISFSNVSNVLGNSTGTGTIKFKGTANRDSAGFIKIYIGTTAYYVPVFSAFT